MGINLQKGQRIDLSKGNDGLSKLVIGLGWDPISEPKKGLFGGLFGGAPAAFDCDASVLMLNANGKIEGAKDVIYFGNLRSTCGSVVHKGDNLTGDGDGDDEQIHIDLSRIPSHISKLVFVVNIYDCANRRQDFGMIRNAFIRVVDSISNKELVIYNLTDNYAGRTSLVTGEIYRYNGGWKFAAIGDGTNDTSLRALVSRYS